MLVGSSAPLDQFVVRNPSYFFDASPEHALINPDNLQILVDHVKCAAFELPFTTREQYGRHDVQEVLGVLEEGGLVHRAAGAEGADGDGHWQWTNESYPADAVSLRSISSDNFVVVDTTAGADVIGETSFNSGPATLHEKAIYLIEGALYQVEKLDVRDGYRGTLSVCIASWYKRSRRTGKCAWESSPDEVAREVWSQIVQGLKSRSARPASPADERSTRLPFEAPPEPLFYHIDYNMRFREDGGGVLENPFGDTPSLQRLWIGLCVEIVIRCLLFLARFIHGGWARQQV